MYDNPLFSYAGINNPAGKQPTIVALANTTNQSQEVKLFNAQENLISENNGLPSGVVANSEFIFEMPSIEFFSCYQTAPFNGFRPETTFALKTNALTNNMFRLNVDVQTSVSKTLTNGFNGVSDPTRYRLFPDRFDVDATIEGLQNRLRMIFGMTTLQSTKNRALEEVVVFNSTTFPCLDRFPLTQTSTGFNSSGSTNASTYQEILQSTNFAPFGVDEILIQSEKIQEIAKNPIRVTERDANGNKNRQLVILQRTPYTRNSQRIMRNIREIDGATEIELTLPPRTTAELYIYEKNRILG
tara:strand:- start:1502 stop:2398 length:897 start_codon:yes stop_codon:yes gene_type:complete